MKRAPFSALVVAVVFVAAFLLPSSPASARDKVHTCTNWSWTGPANWTAVCGTYGITVTSPDGRRQIDWGFSNIFCVPANNYRQSATRYFGSVRRQLAGNGARYESVGRVRQVGRNYFRQTSIALAGRGSRTGKGQLILDYSSADNTGEYCYTSQKLLMVPRSDYRRGIRQLIRIYHSMAYRGPGLPKGPNGEPA